MPTHRLTGISSMATRALLADLADAYRQHSGIEAQLRVGGRRRRRAGASQAGEAFDVVVLAADAIDKLLAAGRAVAGSRDRSGALRRGRRGARRRAAAGHRQRSRAAPGACWQRAASATPPAPAAWRCCRLFERWGIAEALRERIVQAPPGVPVGALVARGEVELGFQQRSELMHLEGIDLIGEMPPASQIVTTFSAALCSASTQPRRGARAAGLSCTRRRPPR